MSYNELYDDPEYQQFVLDGLNRVLAMYIRYNNQVAQLIGERNTRENLNDLIDLVRYQRSRIAGGPMDYAREELIPHYLHMTTLAAADELVHLAEHAINRE